MVKHHVRMRTDPNKFIGRISTLFAAVVYNRWHIVKLLLSVADPDIYDYDGLTPYMLACKRGRHRVIEIMGNDPRVDPHQGRVFAKYPLVRPCIVKAKNFNPNKMYDDRPLLLRTCEHYHEDADGVKLLLRVGADPNLTDKDGVTPLMSAAKDGISWWLSARFRRWRKSGISGQEKLVRKKSSDS